MSTIEEEFDYLTNLMNIKKVNPALLISKLKDIRQAEATFKTVKGDTGYVEAEESTDEITIEGGTNISTVASEVASVKKVTINASATLGSITSITSPAATDLVLDAGSNEIDMSGDLIKNVGTVDGIDISAISLTNMPTAINAWKTLYSNAAGAATELALATTNKYLMSNGAAAAPSWESIITVVDSVSELQAALDAGGTILLKAGTYALTATLDIDQNKSVVLMGEGNETIIDCNGDRTAFNITSAKSCVLRDFKIDASDLTTANKEIIDITEGSNNPVIIERITIVGDNTNGYGVELNSDNCIIRDCYISGVNAGIWNAGDNNKVIENTCASNASHGIVGSGDSNIYKLNICTSNTSYGMYIGGNNNVISGNVCNSNNYGIYCDALTGSVVSENVCNSNTLWGIIFSGAGSYNSICSNTCYANNLNSASNGGGILINLNPDYNTISGNNCCGNANAGAGTGYGIYINNAGCVDNTVMSNTCLGNDTNYTDNGTNTFDTDGAAQALNNIA